MSKGRQIQSGWVGFSRDPIILATIALHLLVVLVTFVSILGPFGTSLVVESYVLVPISLLGVIAPWVGLRACKDSKERLFWSLWSLSLGFHLTVRVVYLLLPDIDYIVAGSFAVDFLYVLFYLPLVLSVLVRPDRPRLEEDGRWAWGLEVAGTAVFTVGLILYFMIIPRFLNQPEYETWVPSLLMYWVLDAFLLVSLFYLRETAMTKEWRIIYSWLALAPSCWVITEMLELTFYLDWGGPAWSAGVLDVLWYLPWIAIIFAGRMREAPFPQILGAGGVNSEQTELSRSFGRPGWLLVAALVLPLVHIGSNLLGLLDPATRDARELVVLFSLILLLGTASLHQKVLERRTVKLSKREQELEERQRRLAAAVEQSPDAVLIADGGGLVRYGNQKYSELEGDLENLLGAPLLTALPKDLDEAEGESLARTLGESLRRGTPWEGRTLPDPDGGGREELVSVSPVRDSEGRVENWVLIRRDVTYLSRLERQFRHAQRMETVGTLAGGIARDFGDLLKEIYGHGEFLKNELAPGSSSEAGMNRLLEATARATELVSRVLEFSEAGQEEEVYVSMDSVAKEALSLLRPSLPSNIRLEDRMEEGSEVVGVRHQLRQVVVNLANNAIQALRPEGGVLKVEVEVVQLEGDEAAEFRLAGGGSFVRVSIRDTGRGMPESVVEKVFDPFFTTKELEDGTGLGLFLVRETVVSHGGGIRVESVEGWGTLFQILLPASGRGASPLSDDVQSEG